MLYTDLAPSNSPGIGINKSLSVRQQNAPIKRSSQDVLKLLDAKVEEPISSQPPPLSRYGARSVFAEKNTPGTPAGAGKTVKYVYLICH